METQQDKFQKEILNLLLIFLKKITKKISTTNNNKYLIFLRKLMKDINPKTFKAFLEKTSWGYPNHYIVFRKTV
jgi:hypothetical protein